MLTKANVRTRLQAIASDPATPADVKQRLDRLLDREQRLGRDPSVVQTAIDTYLDRDPATMNVRQIDRALAYIVANWDAIPD